MNRRDGRLCSPVAAIATSPRLRSALRFCIGALFCSSAGFLTVVLFSETQHRSAIPLLFTAVVVFAAARWGLSGAVIGLLISATLFAVFLFPPIGSINVHAEAARANLGWMVLMGITLAFLFAKPPALKR